MESVAETNSSIERLKSLILEGVEDEGLRYFESHQELQVNIPKILSAAYDGSWSAFFKVLQFVIKLPNPQDTFQALTSYVEILKQHRKWGSQEEVTITGKAHRVSREHRQACPQAFTKLFNPDLWALFDDSMEFTLCNDYYYEYLIWSDSPSRQLFTREEIKSSENGAWVFESFTSPTGDTFFEIKTLEGSGEYLLAEEKRTGDDDERRSVVVACADVERSARHWRVVPQTDGSFCLQNVQCNGNLYVEGTDVRDDDHKRRVYVRTSMPTSSNPATAWRIQST